MPGQIAAIDGGNVLWIERPQVVSVVPVVEVPAKSFEPVERCKSGFQTIYCLEYADPAEFVSRCDGEQVEAYIGRRSSIGDNGLRYLLKIIGRQHVLRPGDESVEEAPC